MPWYGRCSVWKNVFSAKYQFERSHVWLSACLNDEKRMFFHQEAKTFQPEVKAENQDHRNVIIYTSNVTPFSVTSVNFRALSTIISVIATLIIATHLVVV